MIPNTLSQHSNNVEELIYSYNTKNEHESYVYDFINLYWYYREVKWEFSKSFTLIHIQVQVHAGTHVLSFM